MQPKIWKEISSNVERNKDLINHAFAIMIWKLTESEVMKIDDYWMVCVSNDDRHITPADNVAWYVYIAGY